MKTNEELQYDVENAIRWEPLLYDTEIGVTAIDGVVSLTGVVDRYSKKLGAETAAKNVAGVKAVVEKIEIKFDNYWDQSDVDIAGEVLTALSRLWTLPKDKVKVQVENGWITLSGHLNWDYQREDANDAVIRLKGVKGVTNDIRIVSEIKDEIEKTFVESALARNWAISQQDVNVDVSGTKIVLTGSVSSLYQRGEAGRLAWNTPGVWTVVNELVVK